MYTAPGRCAPVLRHGGEEGEERIAREPRCGGEEGGESAFGAPGPGGGATRGKGVVVGGGGRSLDRFVISFARVSIRSGRHPSRRDGARARSRGSRARTGRKRARVGGPRVVREARADARGGRARSRRREGVGATRGGRGANPKFGIIATNRARPRREPLAPRTRAQKREGRVGGEARDDAPRGELPLALLREAVEVRHRGERPRVTRQPRVAPLRARAPTTMRANGANRASRRRARRRRRSEPESRGAAARDSAGSVRVRETRRRGPSRAREPVARARVPRASARGPARHPGTIEAQREPQQHVDLLVAPDDDGETSVETGACEMRPFLAQVYFSHRSL